MSTLHNRLKKADPHRSEPLTPLTDEQARAAMYTALRSATTGSIPTSRRRFTPTHLLAVACAALLVVGVGSYAVSSLGKNLDVRIDSPAATPMATDSMPSTTTGPTLTSAPRPSNTPTGTATSSAKPTAPQSSPRVTSSAGAGEPKTSASTPKPTTKQPLNQQLTVEGLGPFTVGSSLSEVAAVASRYEGVKRNAMDGSGSCVSYESEGWSALVVEKQLLWVDVTSKSVATTLGVRVGDTRETLSAKHPTATPHELDPNFYTVPFKGPNDLAVIVGENGLVDSLIVGRDETIAWGPFAEPCG